jgi:S-adenosylmethionine synthetase
MIRMSEVVLAGHPDKFCDQVADAIVAACMDIEREAYVQVEVATWGDEVWLNGGIATEGALDISLADIVNETSRRIGYRTADEREPRVYRVTDAVCRDRTDPRQWTRKVNDQAIVIGWAGYDAKTSYLPPEHWLAHCFREALETAIRGESSAHATVRRRGRREEPASLRGEGPDGKLLLRIREEGDRWELEHLLVTLQQRATTEFLGLTAAIERVLHEAWTAAQQRDPRWTTRWDDVALLVNPNGPLVSGGSDGDNGQTGRKLVMDYYGPRIPIGGGALSGKHLTHIDRLGALTARAAAIEAVQTGARECSVIIAYAPNEPRPLQVTYQMEGRGTREPDAFFDHDAMCDRYAQFTSVSPFGIAGKALAQCESAAGWAIR